MAKATIVNEIPVGDPVDGAVALILCDGHSFGYRYRQNGGDGDDVMGFDCEEMARAAAGDDPYADH